MPMSLSTSDMTRIKRLENRNTLVEKTVPFNYQTTIYPNTDPTNGSTGNVLNNTPTRAFVLGCIDPRYVSSLENYLANSLVNDEFSYDLFILAGGALGGGLTGTIGACAIGATGRCVVVSTGNNWNEVLKEHIQVGIALHDVKEFIAIDHLDCGAYKNCILCSQTDVLSEPHKLQYQRLTAGTFAANGVTGVSGATFFGNAASGVKTGTQVFTSGITGAYFDYKNPSSNDTSTSLLTYDSPARTLDTNYFPRDYQTKVLVLGCIDPRYSQMLTSFLNNYKGVQFIYDLFILAGASLGVNQSYSTFPTKRNAGSTAAPYTTNQLAVGISNTVGPMGVNWGPTFFDHLSIARLLHQITEVWVFDHLDCGAYKAIKLGGLPSATDLDPAQHTPELIKLQGYINTYTSSTDYLGNAATTLAFKGFIMDTQGEITKVVDSGGVVLDIIPGSLSTFGSSRIRAPASEIIELRAKASADYVLVSEHTGNNTPGFGRELVRTKLTPTPATTSVLETKVGPLKSAFLNRNRL
jgi:carbonic anhydrase